MISTEFTFDGVTSQSMGLQLVTLDRSIPSRLYTSGKDILEDYPNKNLSPYFFGIKHQPLQFQATFTSAENDMNDTKLYQIGAWLFQNKYKPFISNDNPSKIFYCIATNQSDFFTNGLSEGYFTVDFRCRDGFGWTVPSIQTFNITTSGTIQMSNLSNVFQYYYPEIEITLGSSATSVQLVNTSDGNYTSSFTSVANNETIYIDNQKRIIISSVSGANRLNNFNKNWFRLKNGINNIQVTGTCTIKLKSHFPVFN
jgi:phage-related protein